MSVTIGVSLGGLEAVREALDRVPDQVRVLMTDVVHKTTFGVNQRVLAHAPRGETGRLRAAITWSARGLSGRVTIGPDGYYWHFLEYGTRTIKANPFVRTARELEAQDFDARVRDVAKRIERDFSTGRFL